MYKNASLLSTSYDVVLESGNVLKSESSRYFSGLVLELEPTGLRLSAVPY